VSHASRSLGRCAARECRQVIRSFARNPRNDDGLSWLIELNQIATRIGEDGCGDRSHLLGFLREGDAEVELALEPNANPAGKTFQKAMFEQGWMDGAGSSQSIPRARHRRWKTSCVSSMGYHHLTYPEKMCSLRPKLYRAPKLRLFACLRFETLR